MRFLFILFIILSFLSELAGTKPITITVPKADTIHESVYKGDIKKVKEFISKGVDVNSMIEGIAALHWVKGIEIARLLIEHGADVNIETSNINFNIQLNIESDTLLIFSRSTPLHLARTAEIAKLLIEHGADVNAKNTAEETPLHLARTAEIAKLLIEKGADVNAKSKRSIGYIRSDSTSLFYARTAEIAKLLIENGVDVNAKDNSGNTALKVHKSKRNYPVMRILIKGGADVNVKSTKFGGYTVLHDLFDLETAKLLIENGADVNARTTEGKTPLHYARTVEIAKLLIENGADVNARDNYGRTPIDTVELYIVSKYIKNQKKSQGGYSGFSPKLFIKNLWQKVF